MVQSVTAVTAAQPQPRTYLPHPLIEFGGRGEMNGTSTATYGSRSRMVVAESRCGTKLRYKPTAARRSLAGSKEPRSGCRCARWFVSKANFELLRTPSSIATHRDRILTIIGTSQDLRVALKIRSLFRECGYTCTCRLAVHRHFAVADEWRWRGEKINGSQASRNCYGPTRSLIDASRVVALVRCFGGFRE